MTPKEEQDIQFYRGSAVEEYLKKFHLDTAEQKVIDAAIATARSDTPDIALIQKADVLLDTLKEKKRTPPPPKVDEKELARAIANVNMAKYKSPADSLTRPRESNATYRWASGIGIGMLLFAIINYAMEYQGKYTYEEAIEECKEKHQVLPLTVDDFLESGYRFGQPAEFWRADGSVMVSQAWYTTSPDPQSAGYSYICVEKNGKVKSTLY